MQAAILTRDLASRVLRSALHAQTSTVGYKTAFAASFARRLLFFSCILTFRMILSSWIEASTGAVLHCTAGRLDLSTVLRGRRPSNFCWPHFSFASCLMQVSKKSLRGAECMRSGCRNSACATLPVVLPESHQVPTRAVQLSQGASFPKTSDLSLRSPHAFGLHAGVNTSGFLTKRRSSSTLGNASSESIGMHLWFNEAWICWVSFRLSTFVAEQHAPMQDLSDWPTLTVRLMPTHSLRYCKAGIY